ncbi:hypothetical protein RND81_06G159600 [Saponaria officinalis]|uniref:F-box domain-containing protein n=1 Tax=Saponaria officinalis TaxID=3572 RepID=A0AAW1KB97_SAPOF
MATLFLPLEIITNILSRLPSKSLCRFKCVSKQWNSQISSPNFINLYLTQTLISDNYPNLIIAQFSLSSTPISDVLNPNFHFTELNHPLKRLCRTQDFSYYDPKVHPQILGSCNGIVCIAVYDKSSIFLYNPCIKTHRLIPHFLPSDDTNPLLEITPGYINVVVFGFGYDSRSDDYKMMRMIEARMRNMVSYRESSVYSMRDDSWKLLIDETNTMEYILQNGMGVLSNEVLHFVVAGPNYKPLIKCYNLCNETFSFVNLPNYNENFSRKGDVFVRKPA